MLADLYIFMRSGEYENPIFKCPAPAFSFGRCAYIPEINEKAIEIRKKIMNYVVKNYKIHLMPDEKKLSFNESDSTYYFNHQNKS